MARLVIWSLGDGDVVQLESVCFDMVDLRAGASEGIWSGGSSCRLGGLVGLLMVRTVGLSSKSPPGLKDGRSHPYRR